MCGILGIVAAPGATIDLDTSQVVRMRDSMESRGPDACGLIRRDNVALAHRRLSIRDIDGGTQPWLSDDEQTVLVYNGEIYNDRQLRRELGERGHRFRTTCDTEVVMAAYRQWGENCVEHLRGMFALGVYDFRDDRLFLCRDRFGIKPLFFTQVGGTLVFASSIAALLAHPGVSKRPHLPTISHYLSTFRLTLGRQTVYEGIWQLLPAERLTLQNGCVRIDKYWDYPDPAGSTLDYQSAVEQLENGLREAVECRLASDVPVGMFLSGGVDSNVIAGFVARSAKTQMLGQCGGGIGEPNDCDSEDFAFARQCADFVGFEFDEVRVTAADYFDCWQQLIGRYATPLSTPTDVILYRLAQSMKRRVGVVLGGEGADELLCGYAVQHWAGQEFERYRRFAASGNDPSGSTNAFRQSLLRTYRRDTFASPVDHYFALNSLISPAAKPGLLQPWAWEQAEQDRSMAGHYGEMFDRYSSRPMGDVHAIIHHRVNLEGLLGRLDSATMSAGLEARVPYTDHRLVEAMFRLPLDFKIRAVGHDAAARYAGAELERRSLLESKRLLRTLADTMLPPALARRKKASFPTPLASWLAGPWREWACETLLTSEFGNSLFQPAALRELAGNPSQAGMWLWPLLNVVLWGDMAFAGRTPAARPRTADVA